MKLLIILFFLSISFQALPQGLEIIYAKEFVGNLEAIDNESTKKKYSKIIKGLANIEHVLIIDLDNQKSVFKHLESMQIDKYESKESIMFGMSSELTFFDKNNCQLINFIEISGKTFFVETIQNKTWEFTGNRKKILGFETYEISIEYEIKTHFSKPIKKKATAWIAPSLPSEFGPSDAIGFPGLVLEFVYEKTYRIFAKKINEKNKVELDKIKQDVITEEMLIETIRKVRQH